MQRFLANGTGNYFQFKRALNETCGRTLDQPQEKRECAPALGDKMPFELLADLRSIFGRYLQENPLLEGTLKRKFLARLLVYARDPLIIMGSADLNHMAMQADALIRDRKKRSDERVRYRTPPTAIFIFCPKPT